MNKYDKPTKKGDLTKLQMLEIGVRLWPDVTMREIARSIKPEPKTHTAVAYHFKSHAKLMKAIIAHAIEKGHSKVIAYLIVTNHAAVKKMSPADRAKHMKAAS